MVTLFSLHHDGEKEEGVLLLKCGTSHTEET